MTAGGRKKQRAMKSGKRPKSAGWQTSCDLTWNLSCEGQGGAELCSVLLKVYALFVSGDHSRLIGIDNRNTFESRNGDQVLIGADEVIEADLLCEF